MQVEKLFIWEKKKQKQKQKKTKKERKTIEFRYSMTISIRPLVV